MGLMVVRPEGGSRRSGRARRGAVGPIGGEEGHDLVGARGVQSRSWGHGHWWEAEAKGMSVG